MTARDRTNHPTDPPTNPPTHLGVAASEDRIFYGWWVVGASFVAQFMTSGTTFYAYGVLLKPISEDLGASRFAVGSALSALTLVGSLTGPLIGREVDRRGARALMLVGCSLVSAGFFMLSRIESVLGLYVCFGGVVAVGAALLGPIPNTALVTSWFRRAGGTALGISQIGVSLSGMFMAYLATWLVTSYGWRGAALSFAVVPLALAAPVIYLLVVNRPADRGLYPDGVILEIDDDPLPPTEPTTLLESLRERTLWLIALLVGLNFSSSASVIGVIHSHTTDLGYSDARAAGALSLLAGMAALGKPAFGSLSDRSSARFAIGVSMGLQASGLIAVIVAPNYWAIVAGTLMFGFGVGGLVPLFGLLILASFGPERLGHMMGATLMLMLPFQLVGMPFATAVFDATGSYAPAFMTFLVFYALGSLVLTRLPTGSGTH